MVLNPVTMFANINSSNIESADDQDSLRGGFNVLPSGLYEGLLESAYMDQTPSGAAYMSLNLKVKPKDGSGEVADLEYRSFMTNRQGEVFYTRKDSGKKVFLPGFQLVDELCNLYLGRPVSALDASNFVAKTAMQFDPTTKTQVPTEVSYVTSLSNLPVNLAILHKKDFKFTAEGKSEDTREFNEVVKFFAADWRTLQELKKDAPSEYAIQWENNNKGKVRDLTTKGNASFQAGSPATISSNEIKISSILNNGQ